MCDAIGNAFFGLPLAEVTRQRFVVELVDVSRIPGCNNGGIATGQRSGDGSRRERLMPFIPFRDLINLIKVQGKTDQNGPDNGWSQSYTVDIAIATRINT